MRGNTYLCSNIADALSPPPPPLFSFLPFPLPPSPPPSPHRRGGKYNHCRIHTKSEGGKTKFYLIDQMCFDSIYDLIIYYKVRGVGEEGRRRKGERTPSMNLSSKEERNE